MDAYKKIEYKGKTITIWQDEAPMSPRDWDNLGVMVCSHKRYDLGDKNDIPFDEFVNWQEVKAHVVKRIGVVAILPLYLYDHSGITMSTRPFSDAWDSGQVGFIYATAEQVKKEYGVTSISEKLKAKATAILENEVKVYDQYLRGEVYGYTIEGGDGNSCGGFYGDPEGEDSGLMDEARASVDALLKKEDEDLGQALELGAGVYEIIEREMRTDDESFKHKDMALVTAYMKDAEATDRVLMALCGWTYKTLCEKAKEARS